jgi:hypothetical protein
MLSRIYQDKKANGYKDYFKKMFKVEVDIMTDVIQSSIPRYLSCMFMMLYFVNKTKTKLGD